MVPSCRKIGQVSFFASGGALLGGPRSGKVICYSLAIGESHLRFNSAFPSQGKSTCSFFYLFMSCHNNTPLNFDYFFGSSFCQKDTLDMFNKIKLNY